MLYNRHGYPAAAPRQGARGTTRRDERMQHPAGHDPSTDLPDRVLLHDRLAQGVAQGRRRNTPLALLHVDFEELQRCDDLLGAGGRDRLLQEIAARLRAGLRASDTIARVEGDGLALVLPELSQPDAAGTVAGKIVAACDAGFVLDGHLLRPRPSVGIAVFPAHGDGPAQLLRHAGVAATRARAAGGGVHCFAGAIEAALDLRHDLTHELGRALERGQLRLEYQPQFDLRRRRAVGLEALLRWHHPSLGEIGPEAFVELAEASGQIGRIGGWALAQACLAAASWPAGRLGPLRVAVNFSSAQMAGSDLPRVVAHALADSRLAAARLELELTERSVLDRDGRVLADLVRLRAMGVRLALDDFGMGFAGLRHVGRLPLDALKIDRSFVADLGSRTGHAIVQCVIELAHRMGLRVVAEGVESARQLATLRRLGCDEVQGHVLGKPLAAAEVAPWLSAHGDRQS
jgi:diguanylate cyclase (GGDEF)-like protein